MKRAFTLLETIMVLVIIAVISGMAAYKLFYSTSQANNLQVKTQVALVQQGLTRTYNNLLLKGGSASYYAALDNANNNQKNQDLFSKIMDPPLRSTSLGENKVGHWIKQSDSIYYVVMSKSEHLMFVYNRLKGSFECNATEPLCKKLYE